MIAAVDLDAKVVWRIGLNVADASIDAQAEIAKKPRFQLSQIRLDYFPLLKNAPIHLDGETLFSYCLIEIPESIVQIELF